jgi:REP element-mobilizing transposase RayT
MRFQYPGAVYHLMARGDGGKTIFETDEDRVVFVSRLGEASISHGWRVHAWVLMGNHFHLLLETPQANLVAGMKWLLGTFSQGWNPGEEKFRDRLLAMVDRAKGVKPRATRSRGGVLRDHGERDAERLVVEGSAVLGLPADRMELEKIKKGDERKAMLAVMIRRHTGASTGWIAKRLAMGSPGSVSRLTGAVRKDPKKTKRCEKIGREIMERGVPILTPSG